MVCELRQGEGVHELVTRIGPVVMVERVPVGVSIVWYWLRGDRARAVAVGAGLEVGQVTMELRRVGTAPDAWGAPWH